MEASWSVEQLGGAKGRGVVARRAFKPGDTVLEDRAYAYAVVGSGLGSVCDCCLAPCRQPLRCSACKLACYQSKEHQGRAWRAGHREECAALLACAPRVPPTAVRLALRCTLRHWHAQQTPPPQQQDDALTRHDALLQLQHHWDALSDGSKLQFAQMGALAHRLLGAAAPGAAEATRPRDLALLLARFGANSHTISDDELRPLAVGIFPLGALVNHGCQPNVVHSFDGDRMLFRAVRAIRAAEEVTTAYTELAATRWERRRELQRHHQFDIDASDARGPAAASLAGAAAAAEGAPAVGASCVPADAAAAAGQSAGRAGGCAKPASSAAAGAAAAGAEALQCLPAQQPAEVLPLAGGGGELRLYSSHLPPWPHDERDAALSAVVTTSAGSAATSRSSGSGARGSSGGACGSSSSMWGGMWGTLGQPDEAASLAATPAAASFGVDADLAGGDDAAAGQQHSSAPASERPAASPTVHVWCPAGGTEQGGSLQAVKQLAEAYVAALQLQQSLGRMLVGGEAAAALQRLQRSLAALTARPDGGCGSSLGLGPRHVLRMRLLADQHRAAIAAEQWEAALAAAYELLPLYRQAYPPVWPPLGLLWAAVAKLEHLRERPHLAAQAGEQALSILTATHGGSGPAAQAVRQVLMEAAQEAAMRGGGGWRPAPAESDSDE